MSLWLEALKIKRDAILRDPVLCADKQVIYKRYRGRLLEGSALVLCQAAF